MPRNRVPDEVREDVRADILATRGTAEGSLRKIAQRHGISEATVRKIAKEKGVKQCSEATRELMKNAAETQKVRNAERRAVIAGRMLSVAERALDAMEEPYAVFAFGGKEYGYVEHVLRRPPTADQRNLVIIAATAIDKHKILDLYDSDASKASAFDRWLAAMSGRSDG